MDTRTHRLIPLGRPTTLARLGMLLVSAALVLSACSTSDTPTPGSDATSASTSGGTGTPSGSGSPTAKALHPEKSACYQLDFEAAVAPSNDSSPVDCTQEHTSLTFAVGRLNTFVNGHLLAVDSRQVQRQVAKVCPRRLADFLGGSLEQLRLSMLRAVWFTPTLEESDAGASWFRCDVIAVAAKGELLPLTGGLKGALSREAGRAKYAMCGRGQPGNKAFQWVICSRQHGWRAIRTVTFDAERYPGAPKAKAAGQQVCEDAARALAADPLNFKWSYEWPTAEKWRAGQTYGLCWVPQRD